VRFPACSSPAALFAQWAIKLFPFGHIPARHLCMLAAADPRFQIAEAAIEGLQPGKFATGSGGGKSSTAAALPAYPPFEAVLRYLQQAVPQLGRRPAEGGELPLPPKALLAAIAFLESCRRAVSGGTAAAGGGMSAEAAAAYLLWPENALRPQSPTELHAAALAATLSVAAAQRAAFAAAYAADPGRQAVLLRLSAHVDAGARQAAAQLLGLLVAPGTAPPAQQAQQAQRAVTLCEALLSTLRAGGPDGAKHAKQEAVEGAAAAAGYVAANLLQGESLWPSSGCCGVRNAGLLDGCSCACLARSGALCLSLQHTLAWCRGCSCFDTGSPALLSPASHPLQARAPA